MRRAPIRSKMHFALWTGLSKFGSANWLDQKPAFKLSAQKAIQRPLNAIVDNDRNADDGCKIERQPYQRFARREERHVLADEPCQPLQYERMDQIDRIACIAQG